MVEAERVQTTLKNWKRIKLRWNDKKSQKIENTYIEPLSMVAQSISEKLMEINEFVISAERQIEDINDS